MSIYTFMQSSLPTLCLLMDSICEQMRSERVQNRQHMLADAQCLHADLSDLMAMLGGRSTVSNGNEIGIVGAVSESTALPTPATASAEEDTFSDVASVGNTVPTDMSAMTASTVEERTMEESARPAPLASANSRANLFSLLQKATPGIKR